MQDEVLNITKTQSLVIYRVSHLLLLTSMYGFYRGHYVLIIFPSISFVSSINYWRNPKYDLKRQIDIIVVLVSIISHSILAYRMEYSKIYYSILAISLLLYPLSWYFYYRKQHLLSTYTHCMHHILNNMSAIILYSGR